MSNSEKKVPKTDRLNKSALRTFGSIAISIYLLGMYYCYSTAHLGAMAIMGGGAVAVIAIILYDYFSIGRNYKNDKPDENKDHSQKPPPAQKTEVKAEEPEPVMAE